MKYKGYDIIKSSGRFNHAYQIHKDNKVLSVLTLGSEIAAKRVIDTYVKSGGTIQETIFNKYKKEPIVKPFKDPPKQPEIVREVYLSEHEKYIKKLLDEK